MKFNLGNAYFNECCDDKMISSNTGLRNLLDVNE